VSIDKINDLEVLFKMKAETVSRGKKQRIVKRIMTLEKANPSKATETKTLAGLVEESEKANPEAVEKKKGPKKTSKAEATKKVDTMLKKREQKLEEKNKKN